MTHASISQTFHSKHQALDIISRQKETVGGYGTPLCAPEACRVLSIIGDSYTPESHAELEHGYGIWLKGLETGFTHLYWHVLPILPVSEGQVVTRGQIVAYMGNAGNVLSNNVYVPLESRTKNPYPGTHLHWEMFNPQYTLGKTKNKYVLNPLNYLGAEEPYYSIADQLKAIAVVISKILAITK